MDEQQRCDSGMSKRRKVLGNAWVDKGIANRNAFNTEFQELITPSEKPQGSSRS